MNQYEPPITRYFWKDRAPGSLRMEHRVVHQTDTNGYLQIDGVIWPDGPNREVEQLDVEGKEIICVQTKAGPLSVHLIGQAFFSRKLLLRHGSARSVRTVALCTADDTVLRPIAEDLNIEVVVVDGHEGGGSSLGRKPAWVDRWHAELGQGSRIDHLRVVRGAEDCGNQSVYAVVDVNGAPGKRSGRSGADVRGRDLVALTTAKRRLGMYSLGEALVNRTLLLQHGGARWVRSVVLCGQSDSVMDALAAEQGIEVVVMESDTV